MSIISQFTKIFAYNCFIIKIIANKGSQRTRIIRKKDKVFLKKL